MEFYSLKPEIKKKKAYWLLTHGACFAITEKHYYETGHHGKIIWVLCDGSRTVAGILEEMEKLAFAIPLKDPSEYGEVKKSLKKEIKGFLTMMEREGLIRMRK